MTETLQPNLLPEEIPEGMYVDLPVAALIIGHGQAPDTSLIQSIQRFGLLQPIITTPYGDTHQVIDGRRRVIAVLTLGWETISAYVLPAGSVNPNVVQLASHVLRSRNRAAEVDAIEALIKDGANEDTIVAATGLLKQEIRALLPLTTLSLTMRGALREGKMAASVAQDAAKLSPQAQRRLEDVLAQKGKVTAPDVKEQRQVRTQAAAKALDFGSLAGSVPDYEPPPEAPSLDTVYVEDEMAGMTASYVPWAVVLGLVRELEEATKLADLRTAREALCRQLRGWQENGVIIR